MKVNFSGSFSIGGSLVLLTMLLTTFIILSIAAYAAHFVNNIAEKNMAGLGTVVFDVFVNDAQDNDFEETSSIATNLKVNKLVAYTYIINSSNGEIAFSSEPFLKGQPMSEVIFKLKEDYPGARELAYESGGYTLLLGFVNSSVDNLLWHLRVPMIVFLFIGGLSVVALMSLVVNKPLSKLVRGVGEFAKGNLKFRLEKSVYREVDKLVDAYNSMALQLSELYESLELKVQERTTKLERANSELKDA
ncbi:putative signal transduction histidine kinase, partial [Candidatus Gastranaerophilus sp. (ex Termes propinquus)]